MGDVNSDGWIDYADVCALVNHLIGLTPDQFNADAANVNGDSRVDITDVTALIGIIRRQ